MTWAEFKAAVRTLLTVDGVRLNIQDFIDLQIKAGVIQCQNSVPSQRKGHETRYTANSMVVEGTASKGKLVIAVVVSMLVASCDATLFGGEDAGEQLPGSVTLSGNWIPQRYAPGCTPSTLTDFSSA